MFRTERQRQLSNFVVELKNNLTEKIYNFPDLTDAEIEYIYSALASNLLNCVSRWTYEDLAEERKNKDEDFYS